MILENVKILKVMLTFAKTKTNIDNVIDSISKIIYGNEEKQKGEKHDQ